MSDFTKLNRFERVPRLNGASAKARAVWAMAHNALDRRGQMELGGAEWKATLIRRLGVESWERQWFHAGLRELEERGLTLVEGDLFTLLGHAGAERPERARKATFPGPTPDLSPTCDVPTSDLPSTFSRSTLDLLPTYPRPSPDLRSVSAEHDSTSEPRARVQNREEENRTEVEERGEEPASPSPSKSSDTTSVALADPDVVRLLAVYRELHQLGDRWNPRTKEGKHSRAAHIWRAIQGINGDKLMPNEVEAAFRGNAADEWHRKAGKHEIEYVLRGGNAQRFIASGEKAKPAAVDSRIAQIEAAMAETEARRETLEPGPERDQLRRQYFELQADLRAARGDS